jgi:hypothetical protein
MAIEFYDVKTRAKVSVDESDITKVKYETTTKTGKAQVRYAVRAAYDGRNLTKFVSETDWKSLNVSEA